MNLAALIAEANALIAEAKSGAALTQEKSDRLVAIQGEIVAARALEKSIADGEALLKGIQGAGPAQEKSGEDVQAKSLGEHFVKHADVAAFKANPKAGMAAPEFKAAGDPAVVGDIKIEQRSTNVNGLVRQRLTVADLFTPAVLDGTQIVYLEEQLSEGSVKAIAEGEAAPKITYHFTEVREGVSKVAGITTVSDEMITDLPYVASAINGNLTTDLGVEEERQLLRGDGVGSNLKGLENRSGVLTEASANLDDNADAIHRAATKVSIASGHEADAVVIHPLDFERERLAKDANGAYTAGGPLANYGTNPTIWGRTAVVTTAAIQGQVLVGAFASATILRKGGVLVKTSSETGSNFEEGLVSIKAEKRLGIEVRRPSAFAKVTLSTAPAA
jgi:HK97 family phage major capsid protein